MKMISEIETIISEIEFEIGSNKVPRYSCSNHKFNISLRNTIRSAKRLKQVISILCAYAKKTHQTIRLAEIFRENKSMLRNENETRWSSTFLLFSFFTKLMKRTFF